MITLPATVFDQSNVKKSKKMAISDKEFYQLTICINKALNPMEAPLKIKHVRSAIITTHRTKEAKSLWAVIMRQPLMENRFTAWKFCHFLHKVLREGHETTIKHSQTHKKMILEMGKLWGHLHDGVGSCIQSYSKLLVTKLDFHDKNRHFPGSLIIDFREVEKTAGDDINDYFQLCVEIFDYLDEIIEVQSRVFTSINTYRMSSMTPQGQCRLAPLIPLIQDSNPLYDLCVRIMFKLHDKLPSDILTGHRNRFQEMFVKLKLFYDNVRPLQYFADLIQVPHLPEITPNFTSKVDFGSYIPPVVYVQPEPEPVENLVDTSFVEDQQTKMSNPPILSDEIIAFENKIREQDFAIRELQNELTSTKNSHSSIEDNYKAEIEHLTNNIHMLSIDLTSTREVCENWKSMANELETKLEEASIKIQKALDEEERARTSEEKFAKLKAMYTQMRDEHISLLRQNGESSKILQKENSELKLNIELLRNEINEFEEKLKLKDFLVIENTELQSKLKIVSKKLENLETEFNEKNQSYQELYSERCANNQLLNIKIEELQNQTNKLDNYKSNVLELKESLNKVNDKLRDEQEANLTTVNTYKIQVEKQNNEMLELKKQQENMLKVKEMEFFELQNNFFAIENQLEKEKLKFAKLIESKFILEQNITDLQKQYTKSEENCKSILEDINYLKMSKKQIEEEFENILKILLSDIFQTISQIISSKCNETNQQFSENALKYLIDIETNSDVVCKEYNNYFKDKANLVGLASNVIWIGYSYSMLHEQCIFIYNSTTEIEKGQDLYKKVNSLCELILELFKFININGSEIKIKNCVERIKVDLDNIKNLINALLRTSNENIDLGELVENEIEEMSKVINDVTEQFVEMLSKAKSKDNGIKLEVNEKILDACTALMECIKQLIKRSRILQEEIVSSGRGNTSAKEFYKRNHQWSEGLISASKSVAKGAKLLVEAANKAVTSDSNKNFEIIVAAQEIAACTAQLVIASKVKASRENQKLVDLTKASRSVSQATGVIIATVKDCNQHLEQVQDIDLSKLTSSQAKTMEMDILVKVLELEQALQSERLKLSAFRRNNYQNTEE